VVSVRTLLLFSLVFALCSHLKAEDERERSYTDSIQPLFERYCYRCHDEDRAEADIDLSSFETLAHIRKAESVWLRVDEMLYSGQMPPKKARQPTEEERSKLQEWVRGFLTEEARARAGDPGRVVLRRLSNDEYTYTLRDLTGVDSLDPAREFPIDGASGEGFTNVGDGLVMSPTLLTKYLDAAKEVAAHMVVGPTGIEFSNSSTPRDWTDEALDRLGEFHSRYTVAGRGQRVDVQGLVLETNAGGRLPVEEYLAAAVDQRDALTSGRKTPQEVASARGLSTKYFDMLWQTLNDESDERSLVLDAIRSRFRSATDETVRELAAEIFGWQKSLWKFNSIGHVEVKDYDWQQARDALVTSREFGVKLAGADLPDGAVVTLTLQVGDAGDGNAGDYLIWRNPRLEATGKPAMSLSYVVDFENQVEALRDEILGQTRSYLVAMSELTPDADLSALARQHDVDADILARWALFMGSGVRDPVEVTGHFDTQIVGAVNYDFLNGWGSHTNPQITANSSDQTVSVPGTFKPHSLIAHPSSSHFAAVGWQSPVDGVVSVEARVQDAHGGGNGVEWYLQHRTQHATSRLAAGVIDRGGRHEVPVTAADVRKGELVSLIVGARDSNHVSDLTEIQLVIRENDGPGRIWDLTRDVSDDILAGNPHDDSHGNAGVWHFYSGETATVSVGVGGPFDQVPEHSVLARWSAARDANEKTDLSRQVHALATGETTPAEGTPDAVLLDRLRALATDPSRALERVRPDSRFGKHPIGHEVGATDLVVQAPSVLEFRVPASLAREREFKVTAQLDGEHAREGSVQVDIQLSAVGPLAFTGQQPILISDGSETSKRLRGDFEAFRRIFPAALCYERVVPVDEAVTLTLFHREDEHLKRLMLGDAEVAELDALWDHLRFVSQEPLKYLDAFEQIREFATQDRPDLVEAYKPVSQGIFDRAAAFQQRLVDTEPVHLDSLVEFAGRAWRRELTVPEQHGLRRLYYGLREAEMPHEEALRLTLARVLTSPTFLYKREQPPPGEEAAEVSGVELASRLSYFLWSSTPDDELLRVARSGELSKPEVLVAQAQRLLKDGRVRRLAVHFACQWLHIRDFSEVVEKNEKLYPEFPALRHDMREESVLFFQDMFQTDGSVLGLLDADHTFLNGALAKHYGVEGVEGPEWRRVDGMRSSKRGGVFGMATVLASQSGVTRTSPILRGNWVYETLLGERLPKPPPNVPQLPDGVPEGLTARQLIEQHSSVPECARCHELIDPYGFALEQYDTIGRVRSTKVDTKTTVFTGATIEGIGGLRDYLLTDRRDDVLRQFCRKLLGYALGRETQLSDNALLETMRQALEERAFRFNAAVEAIVTSAQFREIRGQEATAAEN
jgi:hypothetical protein